jgi:hypothetical protein
MERRILARWASEPRPRRFFVVETAELGALPPSSLGDGSGGLASTGGLLQRSDRAHGGALRQI